MVALILLLAVDVTVRLHWTEGGGRTVTLPLEHYVAGVLAGEAAGMASVESRKAMAVAARTYALRHRGRHRAEGFDLCDTTHCQDLRISAITQESLAAVAATEGELLWWQGALADVAYSKNCGGWTAGGLRDPWCPRDDWVRTISEAELGGSVEVVGRGRGGRVQQLWFAGRYISGDDFQLLVGRNLGWDRLPSTWFEIARAGGEVVFTGRGRGHGRGLCQEGCARLGASGRDYRKILSFYFPNTVVGTAATGITWRSLSGERVEVFAAQPSARLVELSDEAVAFAEARTGFHARGRPRLWFYPTVAAFRDATGNPGGVAGSADGLTIRMQPESVLRARGVLAQTIRHEVLHVVLEAHTNARHPWWFREGLVVYLNGERPSDAAYRDAAARVTRLVATHGELAVLGWWKTGLPGDGAPGGVDEQPRQSESQHDAGELPAKPIDVRNPMHDEIRRHERRREQHNGPVKSGLSERRPRGAAENSPLQEDEGRQPNDRDHRAQQHLRARRLRNAGPPEEDAQQNRVTRCGPQHPAHHGRTSMAAGSLIASAPG
jgi:hypothetical protein